MLSLPVCRWREEPAPEQYLCRSAKFLAPPNPVGAEFCAACRCADHEPAPALPPALPCVHMGGLTGEDIASKSAGRPVRRAVFGCALHGRCVTAGKTTRKIRSCAVCPDHLPRDPFGPDSTAMLRWAEKVLAAVPEYPAKRFRGRGVVIAGGGDRYFASLYVTIRALRHVGCRLPIQVWYLGRHDEMPPDRQALLAPWQVEFIDADQVRRRCPARMLGGWELKVFATLHSSFDELLFLDADCYPCRNPEFLFELDDYRAAGAIFWPDSVAHDTRLQWSAFGVSDPQQQGSVESGQYVINKRHSWKPLNLAWFYNDHSDYYYRYCHGDKHTFEVAWTRCRQPFVMWRRQAEWADVAYLQTGPDDQTLFVHRCADKFRFKPESYSTPQRHPTQAFHPQLPLEAECWGWLTDLSQALRQASRLPHVPNRSQALKWKRIRIGLPGHFNCAVLEYNGRLLLASRQGWQGAQIFLSELGADFQPRWTRPLTLIHPGASVGAEDPRLFVFQGRLHCAFTGVEDAGRTQRTHQLVCRFDEKHEVEEVWLPDYAGRAAWEKNWQFFEHEGELYSIYAVRPHVVLRHRAGVAEVAAHTAPVLPWRDCHLRGGAPPVRVGAEYYHFFHTVKERNGHFEYAAGLYTFAAQLPFEIRRVAPDPILTAQEHDWPSGVNKSVVFPCGAILRDGQWMISYGYHDRECRLAVIDADQIERQLRPARSTGQTEEEKRRR